MIRNSSHNIEHVKTMQMITTTVRATTLKGEVLKVSWLDYLLTSTCRHGTYVRLSR